MTVDISSSGDGAMGGRGDGGQGRWGAGALSRLTRLITSLHMRLQKQCIEEGQWLMMILALSTCNGRGAVKRCRCDVNVSGYILHRNITSGYRKGAGLDINFLNHLYVGQV
jgi:hypothetical protein